MSLPPDRIAEIQQVFHASIEAGRQLQVRADWRRSGDYFTSLLEQVRRNEITVLNERGVVFRMLDNYLAAETDFMLAREKSRATDDLEGELTAVGGLLDLARTAGNDGRYTQGWDADLRKASHWHVEAEGILAKMPDVWNISKVNALIQFGLLDHEFGNDEQAIREYADAEHGCKELLAEHPGDKYILNRMVRALSLEGLAQTALGDFAGAAASQEEALKVYTELGDARGKENCALGLARLHRGIGDITKARFWYEKTIEFSQREEDGRMVIVDPVQRELAEEELARLTSN